MDQLTELAMHPFAQGVLEKADDVRKRLIDGSPMSTTPKFKSEPDEHEFYLLRTSACLIEVLNCCQQLGHIPVYLSNHRRTPAMEKVGINRHAAIVYHLENYIVRTQGLLDRVLKLVDAVFHLTNDPRNCRYEIITRNVKVQVSNIPDSIRGLKRLADRYSKDRNQIVHHGQFDEDSLRRLEFYFLLERLQRISPKGEASSVREYIQDHVNEILRLKKKEFVEFNREIAASVVQIFDKLAPNYAREEQSLQLRLSKSFD